jgi:hypothetical protein
VPCRLCLPGLLMLAWLSGWLAPDCLVCFLVLPRLASTLPALACTRPGLWLKTRHAPRDKQKGGEG